MTSSQKGGVEKSCILTMLCDFALKPKMESNDEVFNHIASCLGDVSDSSSVRGFILKVYLLLFIFLIFVLIALSEFCIS